MTEHPTPSCGCHSDGCSTHVHDDAQADAPRFNEDVPHATPERPLSDAARRALLEAAERRAIDLASQDRPTEVGGRKGPEPTRFGDWEKKGIAIDF